MFSKDKKARDAFRFSLGGMTAISSVMAPPVVADDRINRIRDAHLRMLETRRSEAAGSEQGPAAGSTDLCVQRA